MTRRALASRVTRSLARGGGRVARSQCTLRYYAQFTRPADQRAAAVIPAQLDEFRKKERLRELFRQLAAPDDPAALEAALGPPAGLTAETALPWLAAFAAERISGVRHGPPSALA